MKPKGQRKECLDCIEQVHGICLHDGWCPLKKKKNNAIMGKIIAQKIARYVRSRNDTE